MVAMVATVATGARTQYDNAVIQESNNLKIQDSKSEEVREELKLQWLQWLQLLQWTQYRNAVNKYKRPKDFRAVRRRTRWARSDDGSCNNGKSWSCKYCNYCNYCNCYLSLQATCAPPAKNQTRSLQVKSGFKLLNFSKGFQISKVNLQRLEFQ